MHTITPFPWFDDRIEEAVNVYVSVVRIDVAALQTAHAGEQ